MDVFSVKDTELTEIFLRCLPSASAKFVTQNFKPVHGNIGFI